MNMDISPVITKFYIKIEEDARIGSTHISLYMALLHTQNLNGEASPFKIKRDVIMMRAKIQARQTYNKCMNELSSYGYINYSPASNGYDSSTVFLIDQNLKQ